MEIGSVFVILALLLLVGIFVARPFLDGTHEPEKAGPEEKSDHERSSLMAEHDRVLNALKELDFDHLLGKIPAEEYPNQRAYLLQKGVEVLKKLDVLKPVEIQSSHTDRLEQELNNRTNGHPHPIQEGSGNGRSTYASASGATGAKPDDEIEILLANRRRIRKEKAAGFCPKCGNPVQKSDHFCPKCGSNTA